MKVYDRGEISLIDFVEEKILTRGLEGEDFTDEDIELWLDEYEKKCQTLS